MKFEIKNRFTRNIVYQNEAGSFRALILAAVKSGANLYRANLCDADLRRANLYRAKNISDTLKAESSIVPESGSFEGWKKCLDGVSVRVLVPAKARRSNASGRKCRAEYVKVLEVVGAKIGVSTHDSKVTYVAGKIVKADLWNDDRWVECGGGIHFFITRKEAELYN